MSKQKERAGLRVTYDPEADVLAINLRPMKESLGASKVSQDHYLHLDAKGRLVSIEILRASEHYGRTTIAHLPNPVEWLTLAEAAAESGLAPTTIRTQIHAGRLPAIKRGRDWLVARHELWNYIDNRAPQGRRSVRERRSSGRRPKTAATA